MDLALGTSLLPTLSSNASPIPSTSFLEPKKALAIEASVEGFLAFGKVRSVRPTALD